MKYNQLGVSELFVSELSFGCMSLKEDFSTSERLIHNAFEKGINYFDTADLYQNGYNEEVLGRSIKNFRKDVIIATKVGNQIREDGKNWDWNPRKSYILKAVEDSLKRLQTDYIDLYQLHGGTIDDPIDETIEAFEILKREGKIRYYGISSIRPNVIKEYVKQSNMVSVMMQYSLLDRRAEEECLQLLYDHNIGVLARGGLAKGILAGKPAKEYLDYNTTETKKVIDKLTQISIATNKTICNTALQFVIQQPTITSAVLGIRTAHQLEECLATLQTIPLLSEELEVLYKISKANTYDLHR
ncbi:aldo/keto reductase [Aquimarina algicola]|uniref:Aldo/keto reductase n=1 Tax=Aquimarina algicola TaxID=2589995 RepID=A0A504J5V5_9FLAO|nr:aldo/keto reductase [Aquimarina algicola]TPN83902.1 aldo/keto reductase [Aquimarina algicola]